MIAKAPSELVLWPSTGPDYVRCAKCATVSEPAVIWLAPGNVMFRAGVQFKGECLVHTCQRCGYSYSSLTSDQADAS